MSTITKVATAALALGAALAQFAAAAPAEVVSYGFGSTPTASELARFYSPLPDGRGLPTGSGSVAQGRAVYEAQCVACHGQKLEGGLGDRLIGGRGTLSTATATKAPVKTIESYWPYATTIFDYVKRSMPFNAPDSLTHDQVYAVTAYILSEAQIVDANAVLNEHNLAQVQMPNRYGFIADQRPERFPSVAASPRQTLGLAAPAK